MAKLFARKRRLNQANNKVAIVKISELKAFATTMGVVSMLVKHTHAAIAKYMPYKGLIHRLNFHLK